MPMTFGAGGPSYMSRYTPGYGTAPGKLYSWGYNRFGNMGIGVASENTGPYYNFSSPVQVGSLNTWTSMACGWNQLFAGQSNGSVWTWGQGDKGELGLGDFLSKSSPVQLGSPGQWTLASTSTGSNTASSGLQSGRAFLWGQVGGTPVLIAGFPTTYASVPVQLGARTDWKQINTTAHFANGIIGGKLYSWGENDWGQLGLGYSSAPGAGATSPIQVGTRTDWRRIVNTKNLTAAALDNGWTLWMWGQCGSGQLGNLMNNVNTAGSLYPRPSAVLGGHPWSYKISVGYGHVLAIDRSGYLWVWGSSSHGTLGLGGPLNDVSSPIQLGSNKWKFVGAGWDFSVAVRSDGTLWTWGKNKYGRLGLGDTVDRSSPVQVGSGTTWVSCFAQTYTGFGIRL